ncbi:HAMP domain-containing histidine kinase [Zhouia spongiae]|uniref:histidine kinase n=1 Tax=Zhouia spongiae TaxID=2202721 RepID=A0ABY3YKE7_9FLAO|nr:HAMP domain-containing sensor histidine kinase [Zhouia spongiae]UNY98068.1 HAMP domain-containing histidine kinase [Zhouia spongiae]
MNLSFKNRIALHYMIATAVIMLIIFSVIFFVVRSTVYHNLDSDLAYEAHRHTDEIIIVGDSLKFINKLEWEEKEHKEVQVNPVFLQIIDKEGKLMDKSPNLKHESLAYRNHATSRDHINAELHNQAIRQVQIPIEQNGETKGYILAAMSMESSKMVILKLKNVLIFSFLTVLIGLYFISRYLAGRSILPISEISNTTKRITKNNLNERVNLPQHKDELYELSANFNELLQRIENAIERERQFTSDASHELRTPLAALRGTLEVLIRKERTHDQYVEKVQYSLKEINRMSETIDQLLLLARIDSGKSLDAGMEVSLPTVIDEILMRNKQLIQEKNLHIHVDFNPELELHTPQYYTMLIMENVIHNAIKYSNSEQAINIRIHQKNSEIICTVQDQGIGIKKDDMDKLFNSFFRSDALNHKDIKGNGLGLSIVKKAADAIQAKINIKSELHHGTTFTIVF